MIGHVRYVNLGNMPTNRAYSQAVVVSGDVKTIYVGGQNAVDVNGQVIGKGDIKAQTEQALKNLTAVLTDCGAKPENVVKWTV